MSADRGTTSIYADDPTAALTADTIDALWRVAASYLDPDADDVDERCAVLASFALSRGMTVDEFDRWCSRAVARLARPR